VALPAECDSEKLAEIAIGLMYLGFYGPEDAIRSPKGYGRDVLGLLYDKGWISDPKDKSRSSVGLTEDGETQAALMFAKYFEKELR